MAKLCRPVHRARTAARQQKSFSTTPGAANDSSLPPSAGTAGKHDACFMPASSHVTGDIDIHEMAWDKDGILRLINTRFSCLCTLDPRQSFVARWRPACVSSLAPEDRCHLNGLGLAGGKPRFVTAQGENDEPQGWRERKADGGVLIDLATDRVLRCGLSLPHSPRVYKGWLWFLESGNGSPSRRRKKLAGPARDSQLRRNSDAQTAAAGS